MKTLADLKRLKEGSILKLIKSRHPAPKIEGITMKVVKKQTNAIKFEDGSYLYFPSADKFKGTEKGFIILDYKSNAEKLEKLIMRNILNGTLDVYKSESHSMEKGITIVFEGVIYYISNLFLSMLQEEADKITELVELLEYEVIN